MPRHVAYSAKKRKVQLKEKRAIKRGDVEAPDPSTVSRWTKKKRIPHHGRPLKLAPGAVDPEDRARAARKLQSAFLKPSRSFLDLSQRLAAELPLPRPIPSDSMYPPLSFWDTPDDIGCPRRPEWRFDMSKSEIEDNEQRQYDAWLESAKEKFTVWRGSEARSSEELAEPEVVRSPSYFELNLEVWRQLWRVSELSPILLVLLDSRCPPLHIPPSLRSFIHDLKPERQLIFVLTKTDIVGPECSEGWKSWLEGQFPGTQVILTRSYRQKAGQEEQKGQGARRRHEAHLEDELLASLIGALKNAHRALTTPPDQIRSNPEELAKWVPRVRQSVDWDAILRSRVDPELIGKLNDEDSRAGEEFNPDDKEACAESPSALAQTTGPLTIGLIGQPNVGKSSLLNALFGQTRVSTSRTPGKTKHFQTLFWTPEIRLVDCPGLVLPNYVPMEIQALCSTLPISKIPSLPSCIRTLGSLMPLEDIFDLTHPSVTHPEPVVEDKRTWRVTQANGTKVSAPKPSSTPSDNESRWTAIDVMTAYALKKGWMVARVGRPDINRAGDAILRTVAENRVRWAFWPLGVTPTRSKTRGIWLADNGDGEPRVAGGKGYLSEDDDDVSGSHGSSSEGESEEEEDETDSDGSEASEERVTAGFDVLALESEGDEKPEKV